jgi:HK97 gp10 family phage protein
MPAIVGGMDKLMQQLDAVGLEFTVEDLIPGANVILAYAQDLCPVDTGFLRDSGFTKVESDDVLIGFDAEYASYVEFGTYKMEAQPFLRPAIDEAEPEALSAIVSTIESHLRDITA